MTAKPGKGPDSRAGRIAMLARLQTIKSELDALLWSSAKNPMLQFFYAEVHGVGRELLSACAMASQRKARCTPGAAIPQNDARLGSLVELSGVAYELMEYADFPRRGWLRMALAQSTVWEGDQETGVERVTHAEVSAVELQHFVREAILVVANAEDGPARRSQVRKRDLKDLMITASDSIRDLAKEYGWPADSPHRGREFSRDQLGWGLNGAGAEVGDPLRPLAEDRVRKGIQEAVKEKLLRSNGKPTNGRKYEVTEKGWKLAHGTVQVDRACMMLRQSPARICVVKGRLELKADSGVRVVFELS